MSNNQYWLNLMAAEGDEHDFESHGLKCAIRRLLDMGCWCGYVMVDAAHPCHGKQSSDELPELEVCRRELLASSFANVPNPPFAIYMEALGADSKATVGSSLNVHWGVTYCDRAERLRNMQQYEGLWAIGFDCGHCNDFSPVSFMKWNDRDWPWPDQHYRDKEFVIGECEKLAEQLAFIRDAYAIN